MRALNGLRPMLNTIQSYVCENQGLKGCLSEIESKINSASREFFTGNSRESIVEEEGILLQDTRRILESLSILNPEDNAQINTIDSTIKEMLDAKAEIMSNNLSFDKAFPNIARPNDEFPIDALYPVEELPALVSASDIIPRPTRSNAMNKSELDRWVLSHPESVRESVMAASEKVRHVSQEQFEEALGGCADQLMAEIQENHEPENFKFSVYGQAYKSNKWVFKLAQNRLPSLNPEKFLDAKVCSTLHPEETPENIMIFDDATYSGEQLSRIVRDISLQVKRVQSEHSDVPMPKVWICIPFMTNKGEENVRDALASTGMDFFIADHERIDTVKELFGSEPETLGNLDAMWGFSKSEVLRGSVDLPPDKIRHLQDRAESQGLIYFDHKVGDSLSFPQALSEGLILDKGKRVVSGGFKIISNTHPPYKEALKKVATPSSHLASSNIASPSMLLRKSLGMKARNNSLFESGISKRVMSPNPAGGIGKAEKGS